MSVIGIAALGFAGWRIFREVAENLLARRMTMEISMTIAIVAAFGKAPEIRELAQNVTKAQEGEVTMMRAWLAENAKQ